MVETMSQHRLIWNYTDGCKGAAIDNDPCEELDVGLSLGPQRASICSTNLKDQSDGIGEGDEIL